MDELDNIPVLLNDLRAQSVKNFRVVCCVNQPENWWDDDQKLPVCKNNQETIRLLKRTDDLDLMIINRSTPGNGWTGKHFGVGWARKTTMDVASKMASPDKIIVTMDGDTRYPPDYLEHLQHDFNEYPNTKAITAQYYHHLTGKKPEDFAVLRYEIYMRYFALNMLRIGNPYAFTAIGSAMACTAKAYQGIRGITPHKSGEDFYFIQKLRKYGDVKISTKAVAYPAARFSDRVFFGTGPAMIRGNDGDWSGYPIYPHRLFDQVKETFDNFINLYQSDLELPMSEFLHKKFGDFFLEDLRRNAKSAKSFTRACWHKVDGLRVLQFLKSEIQESELQDEKSLMDFFKSFYPDVDLTGVLLNSEWSFRKSSAEQLDKIRKFLFEKENLWRKKIDILQ